MVITGVNRTSGIDKSSKKFFYIIKRKHKCITNFFVSRAIILFMNWRKWLDEFVLAGKGILLATRENRFWCGFIPAFLFFGLLMNLLSGGFSQFELMGALGFPDSLGVIWDNFIGVFGIGRFFLDWLPVFAISMLQGVLIGLIVFLWSKKFTN